MTGSRSLDGISQTSAWEAPWPARWPLRLAGDVPRFPGSPSHATSWFRAVEKREEKSPARAEGLAQPGAGVGPFLAGLVDGDAQGGGHVLVAQPGEVAQVDDLGRDRVLRGQPRQGLVQGHQLVGRG